MKSKLIFLLAFAPVFLCGKISAQVSEADFEALKAIYESTDGKNWTNNSGWDFKNSTAADVKAYDSKKDTGWFGIKEIRKGRVSKLELPANGLKGDFPDAIYDLDQLRNLDLTGNELTGKLSPKIANLKKMSSFRLSDNRLTGEIPAEIVLLGSQAKTYGPREDGKGGNEIKIHLNKNKFTGSIPSNIGEMALLFMPAKSISLDLSNNQLTGEIPSSVLSLTEITTFKAAANKLTGTVPAGLESLPKIRSLRLEKNAFTGAVPRK